MPLQTLDLLVHTSTIRILDIIQYHECTTCIIVHRGWDTGFTWVQRVCLAMCGWMPGVKHTVVGWQILR